MRRKEEEQSRTTKGLCWTIFNEIYGLKAFPRSSKNRQTGKAQRGKSTGVGKSAHEWAPSPSAKARTSCYLSSGLCCSLFNGLHCSAAQLATTQCGVARAWVERSVVFSTLATVAVFLIFLPLILAQTTRLGLFHSRDEIVDSFPLSCAELCNAHIQSKTKKKGGGGGGGGGAEGKPRPFPARQRRLAVLLSGAAEISLPEWRRAYSARDVYLNFSCCIARHRRKHVIIIIINDPSSLER